MQLSLSARPKTLDDLVGQDKLVKSIRRGIKKSGVPKGYLFWGDKGSGKTSIARILALSFQCTHQERFGQPCKMCRSNRSKFPIYELQCSKVRGVEDMEHYAAMADREILGRGKRKVFILDELQRASSHAQDVLLPYLEDEDSNSVWIATTTRPDKIAETVRSRLKVRAMLPLDREHTLELVQLLLKKRKSPLKPDDLADALVENSVSSARLIAHATEAYLEGSSAEDAADVDSSTKVSSMAICRAVIKGDWEAVSGILKKSPSSEVRALRASVIGYLRTILLNSSVIDDRSKAVADSIRRLSYVGSAEDANQIGALSAELFSLCDTFKEYTF